jgi:Uma2 family endonuclease
MTPTITPPSIQPFTGVNGTHPAKPTANGVAGWSPLRWTIREYRKLGESGFFSGVKTMLIRGEIFTMATPNPPHDEALNLTQEYLRQAFATGHHVRNQQGFDIGTDTDPSPDLAVVSGSIRELHGRTPTSAMLIVEISDTSLFDDLTTKAELYATAGVREYWVVDVTNRQLHIFRDPVALPAGLGATAYRTHLTLPPEETIAPLAAESASVRVADLLP